MEDANPAPQVSTAAAAAVAAAGVESLVAVRDRLFHTLFIRFTLSYARAVSPFMRRLIETLLLLKGILCLILLLYIHMFFMRNPLDCLDHLKGLVPRDGILRVEIIKNASENYTLKDSYEKEKHVHTLQRKADLAVLGIFMSERNLDMYDYDLDDVYKDVEEEKEEGRDDHVAPKEELERLENIVDPKDNTIIENETFQNNSSDLIRQYRDFVEELVGDDGEKLLWDENVSTLGKENDELPEPTEEIPESNLQEKGKSSGLSDEAYIVEYSLEYGFLRLSQATRERLNISVNLVVLDPNKHSCFRDSFSKIIMENFMGYDDVLMGSIKSLAEHDSSKGYLRNVVSGSHYHFVTKWTSSASYMTATMVMMIFTVVVTVLLRFSQQQIFIFIVEILQMLELNTAAAFPGAPLLTVILALVGMEAIMSEFFEDTTTAFYIIITVWMADQYDTICSHTPITKKYWLRFFYLYHFFFYAYQYRFGGQFTGLAIFIMWFFTHHSMLYFFHHYEMPFILQNYQLLELTPRIPQREGAPPAQARFTVIRNVSNNTNANGSNNFTFRINSSPFQTPEVRRRFGGVRFAGFHFRLGPNPASVSLASRTTLTEAPTQQVPNTSTVAAPTDSDIQLTPETQISPETNLQTSSPEVETQRNVDSIIPSETDPISTVTSAENSSVFVPETSSLIHTSEGSDELANSLAASSSDPPTRNNEEPIDPLPLD